MKVLIGLREISGYCTKLNTGLQSLGMDSTFVNLSTHAFKYADGVQWPLIRLIRFCGQRYAAGSFFKLLWGGIYLALSAILWVECLFRFDVFIFVFGTSFVQLYDLPVLKFFRKRVIFLFLGSDARPPYLNGAFIHEDDAAVATCIRRTRQSKARIRWIERYADVVISLPTYGQFHEKPFVHYSVMGFPSTTPLKTPTTTPLRDPDRVRILHSPSNPILKGTPEIRQAIQRLQARGYAIDWIELTGQPNAVVLRELEQCDFIVDQLYADWPLPGFATEAASMGKASIVAGYDLESLEQQIPAGFVPPVHICHPDDIEAAIEKLIADRIYRLELGQRAQMFVEQHWAISKLAARFKKVIEDTIPEDWWYDPAQNQTAYLHGGGISEARLIPFLRAFLRQGSRTALQVSDKPALEQQFVELASAEHATRPHVQN
ncbi:MAG: hypothetical protein ABI690_20060 [Chloroflexota bacterium]